MVTAKARESHGVAILRSVLSRLAASGQASRLPHIVLSQIAAVKECAQLLSSPRNSSGGGEAAVVVHNFHTRITSLSQGRAVEERWSAAILIKATVESGGYECLSRSKHWVLALLSNLKKPDPPGTKALYIATLTRIFSLTWTYPSLVRDITTQALGPYVKTCLQNISPENSDLAEVRNVLESFALLLPHHHTTFRTYALEIRELAERMAGIQYDANKTEQAYFPSITDAASRLLVALHQCEPKLGYASSWEKAVEILVSDTHKALDMTLSCVREEWDGVTKSRKSELSKSVRRATLGERISAISANSTLASRTMHCLASYLVSDSIGSVAIPVARIGSIIERLFSITVDADHDTFGLAFTSDAERDERDETIKVIPNLHLANFGLIHALMDRFAPSLVQLAQKYLPCLQYIFASQMSNKRIRTAAYHVFDRVLRSVGHLTSKDMIIASTGILTAACHDVTQSGKSAEAGSEGQGNGNGSRGDYLLKRQHSSDTVDDIRALHTEGAAAQLLTTVCHVVPASLLPGKVWRQTDRAIVLSQNRDALLRSCLNNFKKSDGAEAASLVPFLARCSSEDQAAEWLLRPRMPVIQSGALVSVFDADNTSREGSRDDASPNVEQNNGHHFAADEDTNTDVPEATREQHSPEASGPTTPELGGASVPTVDVEQVTTLGAICSGHKRHIETEAATSMKEKRQRTEHSGLSDQPQTRARGRTCQEPREPESVASQTGDADGRAERTTDVVGVVNDSDDGEFVIPQIVMPFSDEED